MKSVELVPFFSSPAGIADDGSSVFVTLTKTNNEISAEFILQGVTSDIQWPAAANTASQGAELWKHTCFELFVTTPGNRAYWEYNFSPSRQWAIYAFKDYRQPIPPHPTTAVVIDPPQLSDTRFSMQVRFTIESPLIHRRLRIGACAVIETIDDQRRYYALRHCDAKPDFHLRESFILEMN